MRIPKSYAQQAGLEENGQIDLSLVDGKLLVEPVTEPSFSLDELLAGVTDENLQTEVQKSSSSTWLCAFSSS